MPRNEADEVVTNRQINKPEFVGVLGFCRIQYLHLTREVDFAKQKTEGEIARAFTTPQSCLRQASSPDKWSSSFLAFKKEELYKPEFAEITLNKKSRQKLILPCNFL